MDVVLQRLPVPDRSHRIPKIEWAPQHRMWRRQHAEGPIDDRWTFLRRFTDETTGKHRILESRKEWLVGHSSARRTYYMEELPFKPADCSEEEEEEGRGGGRERRRRV